MGELREALRLHQAGDFEAVGLLDPAEAIPDGVRWYPRAVRLRGLAVASLGRSRVLPSLSQAPGYRAEREKVYGEVVLTEKVDSHDINRMAFCMILANYDQTGEEIPAGFPRADRNVLLDAVVDNILCTSLPEARATYEGLGPQRAALQQPRPGQDPLGGPSRRHRAARPHRPRRSPHRLRRQRTLRRQARLARRQLLSSGGRARRPAGPRRRRAGRLQYRLHPPISGLQVGYQ